MKFNLDNLLLEYERLEQDLSNPEVFKDQKKVKELSARKKQIHEVVELYKEYKNTYFAYNEAKEILYNEKDEELRELAKIQKEETSKKIIELEEKIKIALLPKDKDDDRDIIVEIRARAWWDEASLFAWELYKAYLIFAQNEWFKTEVIEESINEEGWVKEVIFRVKWEWAYARFKYESWVHRVQRIPETESKWRIHTSTATVAIMPEVDDFDIEIKETDLDIKACRASWAWWQHVNKTDSAIHMTHIPTGISVFCQEWRSQHKNRERALQILKSKIYAMEKEKRAREIWEIRFSQVWSWDRSEKIRTYNFPQDRVTDHRIWQNFSGISLIMMWKFWHIVDALRLAEQKAKLEQAWKLEWVWKKNN